MHNRVYPSFKCSCIRREHYSKKASTNLLFLRTHDVQSMRCLFLSHYRTFAGLFKRVCSMLDLAQNRGRYAVGNHNNDAVTAVNFEILKNCKLLFLIKFTERLIKTYDSGRAARKDAPHNQGDFLSTAEISTELVKAKIFRQNGKGIGRGEGLDLVNQFGNLSRSKVDLVFSSLINTRNELAAARMVEGEED